MLHEVIIEYISRNRDSILSYILPRDEEGEELPRVEWGFLPQAGLPGPIVGVDGSVNAIEYKGCLFVVANAEAVATLDGAARIAAGGFADFLLPYWLPRERSRTYMSILELRVALHALEALRDSIVLMDGSLLNLFPKSLRRYYSPGIAAEYEDRVDVSPCRGPCDSAVRGIVRGLAKEDIETQKARRMVASLELVELAVLLREILERHRGRVIWIAKNSTDNSLFKRPLSDIAVLERFTRGRGYVYAGTSQLEPPRGTRASDFLSGVDVYVYYARLGERGPVLRIEAPYMEEERARRVIGGLSAVSPAGYPYVLRRAHRDVVVRKGDIGRVAKLLGLNLVTPSRWYL